MYHEKNVSRITVYILEIYLTDPVTFHTFQSLFQFYSKNYLNIFETWTIPNTVNKTQAKLVENF